jgi:zinc protease
MALAWMNSAGVHQMIGYTVPTWYGYAGWGVLDYFVEQPGRYSLAEAFHANLNSLIWKLSLFGEHAVAAQDANKKVTIDLVGGWKEEGLKTQDVRGLIHDRDVVAFYGDPGWDSRMADKPKYYDQSLEEKDGIWTFTITPRKGALSFDPVNRNGAQRGYRPIFAWLPTRIGPAQVVEGVDLHPVITDDFILIPNPRSCDPSREYKVVFTSSRRQPNKS